MSSLLELYPALCFHFHVNKAVILICVRFAASFKRWMSLLFAMMNISALGPCVAFCCVFFILDWESDELKCALYCTQWTHQLSYSWWFTMFSALSSIVTKTHVSCLFVQVWNYTCTKKHIRSSPPNSLKTNISNVKGYKQNVPNWN